MTPSLEGWPTKTKGVTSPHEVRLAPLDAHQYFHVSGVVQSNCKLSNKKVLRVVIDHHILRSKILQSGSSMQKAISMKVKEK